MTKRRAAPLLRVSACRTRRCRAKALAARPAWCSSCMTMSSSRSEEHTSELQSLMRISYAVFCLKTKITATKHTINILCTTSVIYKHKRFNATHHTTNYHVLHKRQTQD